MAQVNIDDRINAHYFNSHTPEQRAYHRRMTEAFHQISSCADGLWENLNELLPDGADQHEYYATFQTRGQVTCQVDRIHGYLTCLRFTYRGVPIEFRKHTRQNMQDMHCSTHFPMEDGNNVVVYPTNIDQQDLAKHYLQCMYNYITQIFIPSLSRLGAPGPRGDRYPNEPATGGRGGGPVTHRGSGPDVSGMGKLQSSWALVDQQISHISSMLQ
jgi:hypothetical protein